MGTRSTIARENEDGSIDSIYCHWDGYPSNNGRILLEHYQDLAKISKLLALGNLSSLGPEIGTKHAFNNREGEYQRICTSYSRDRGEKGVKAKHFKSGEELAAFVEEGWTEWVYLWKEGKWYFTNNPSPTWFKCCGTQQRMLDVLTRETIEAV